MHRKTKTEWETRGGRLKWAIKRLPPDGKSRGVGLFIQRLGRGTTGANYPSINGYLSDQVLPPLDFLEAAARVLGVRFEWLAIGKGLPTEEEERARLAGQHRDEQAHGTDLVGRLRAVVPGLEELDPDVEGMLMMHITRRAEACGRLGITFGDEDIEKAAAETWIIITDPVLRWHDGIRRRIPVGPREFSDYARAILHALDLSLRLVAPEGLSSDDIAQWEPIPAEEDTDDAEET